MLKHEDNAVTPVGGVLRQLAGISVTVTDKVTGLPASLYKDDEITPIAQPLTTDNNGYYSFKAPDGTYMLTFSGQRIATFTREIVLDDPKDNPYATKAELAAGTGAALVMFTQAGAGAVARPLPNKLRESISVADFGAVGDGVTSDAHAFQKALTYAHSIGGAKVIVPTPAVAWVLDYPVFVRDDTELAGTGASCRIIVKNPLYSKGRGGIVIGSSLEANRDTALAAYAAGTYPTASTRNNAYVNPAPKQYLRDNPQFIEARNSTVHGLYLVAQFDNPADWGGYGVNIVNAWNCHAYDIWGEGWTQLIGMGSDVIPETPSNYLCTARRLRVVKPDPVHTYYSVGFIANSTDCEISDAHQYAPVTVGSTDGSGAATNLVENCVLKDIRIPKLGRSLTSQGVLLNNAKGCIVDDIIIGDAKTAVATFYTDATFNDATKPNKIGPNITGDGCDKVVEIGAKRAIVLGVRNAGSMYDLAFLNSDASNNTVNARVDTVYTPSDQARRLYFANNSVQGWRPKTVYLRPADLLLNEKAAAALAYDTNKGVEVKTAGTTLYFLWRPTPDVRAISTIEAYVTYKDNAQAAGTNFKIQVRRMVNFNGNAGEAPYIEATVTDTATNTATLDKSVLLSGSFVEPASATNGLANSVDVLLTLSAPTLSCVVKETRIVYYGD